MDQLGNRHFHILFHLKFMVRKDRGEGRSKGIERVGLGLRGRGGGVGHGGTLGVYRNMKTERDGA